VAAERQIGSILYPDSPNCVVFFGHHKCGSRFFRNQIFKQIADIKGARLRKYEVASPPFKYSISEDLDICNMDFDRLGVEGPDVVLFSNAGERSLAKVRDNASEWLGVRVLRDPRQVLVSNYFHHKGDHQDVNEEAGWIWEQLVQDKPILRDLPEEEGLLYELDNISKDIIENQLLANFDDPAVLTIKLEDFSANPTQGLSDLAVFLKTPAIAGIDMARTGANPDSGKWQNHFTSRLRRQFKERYGEALIDLGYADDMDW
ncbi:MAG: hypothetical protein AAF850_10545, partial [Pseudomonadota bacterium]